MLPSSVTFKTFQPVGVKGSQVAERRCCIENAQTFFSLPPKRFPLADLIARSKAFRFLASVTPYHSAFFIIDE